MSLLSRGTAPARSNYGHPDISPEVVLDRIQSTLDLEWESDYQRALNLDTGEIQVCRYSFKAQLVENLNIVLRVLKNRDNEQLHAAVTYNDSEGEHSLITREGPNAIEDVLRDTPVELIKVYTQKRHRMQMYINDLHKV